MGEIPSTSLLAEQKSNPSPYSLGEGEVVKKDLLLYKI